MNRKKTARRWLQTLALPLILTAVLLWFFTALQNLDSGRWEQGRQQLESSLRQAATAYYAAQGVYPPQLEELTRSSGVQIDEEYYTVFYDIFAENLMPDITVLVNEK